MNTTPDETSLAQWLEDDCLDATHQSQLDAWAAQQPDWLAQREHVRAMKKQISASFSAAVEPPASAFFNARILHEISKSAAAEQPVIATLTPKRSYHFAWLSAAACVVGAFFLGRGQHAAPEAVVAANPVVLESSETPMLYAPMIKVKANYVSNKKSDATVIVLDGVKALPDQLSTHSTVKAAKDPDAAVAAKLETPAREIR